MLQPLGTPKAAHVSESPHRRLNSYALAATAAGVGILTLAPPAEAKIVYTKAHRTIQNLSILDLDLNHDGKSDFTFCNALNTASSGMGESTLRPRCADE